MSGEKLLMTWPEEKIRAAIERWKGIRAQCQEDDLGPGVRMADRMIGKYEGELNRRAGEHEGARSATSGSQIQRIEPRTLDAAAGRGEGE